MILFSDPAMRDTVMQADAWRSVRAVRHGHVLIAPGLPFGWVEEPPSINRLLGLAWLGGRDPVALQPCSMRRSMVAHSRHRHNWIPRLPVSVPFNPEKAPPMCLLAFLLYCLCPWYQTRKN